MCPFLFSAREEWLGIMGLWFLGALWVAGIGRWVVVDGECLLVFGGDGKTSDEHCLSSRLWLHIQSSVSDCRERFKRSEKRTRAEDGLEARFGHCFLIMNESWSGKEREMRRGKCTCSLCELEAIWFWQRTSLASSCGDEWMVVVLGLKCHTWYYNIMQILGILQLVIKSSPDLSVIRPYIYVLYSSLEESRDPSKGPTTHVFGHQPTPSFGGFPRRSTYPSPHMVSLDRLEEVFCCMLSQYVC